MAEERGVMECDVVIVGAGPAGLSAAIRLMQLAEEKNKTLNVVVLDKGSEVGAHILSGCVLEPRALNELLPDWKERGAPIYTEAKQDKFCFLTDKKAIKLPTPPQMKNEGNYIISLGNLCRWMAKQAEAMGVQVFPGFPAGNTIVEGKTIKGIMTSEFGIDKNGQRKDTYQAPMELRAKYTIFAEGCRGSLAQRLMRRFNLRDGVDPQTYGIGIKEIWEVEPDKAKQGHIMHTVGWPLPTDIYGGSFLYHLENNQVAVGFVVGLDYDNPHLDPYMEFQRFKTHPSVKPTLEGGKRIAYGARALNEGGFQSIPKLTVHGGLLCGCAAGFMNVAKIKGTHTAMKSGILAAEAVFPALSGQGGEELTCYTGMIKSSWLYEELHAVRNIRPSFHYGLVAGLLYSAIDTYLFKGNAPWTFHHKTDHTSILKAKGADPIPYPKPDGVITFDRMSSVYLSNTNHEEDQPVHLTLKDKDVAMSVNWELYNGLEQRFCPAGVYEYVEDGPGQVRLQINSQNCIHCKTCDIKDPSQNIIWVPPEGGGGPNYGNM